MSTSVRVRPRVKARSTGARQTDLLTLSRTLLTSSSLPVTSAATCETVGRAGEARSAGQPDSSSAARASMRRRGGPARQRTSPPIDWAAVTALSVAGLMSPRLCSIQTSDEALRRLGRATANRREDDAAAEAARGANSISGAVGRRSVEGGGLREEEGTTRGGQAGLGGDEGREAGRALVLEGRRSRRAVAPPSAGEHEPQQPSADDDGQPSTHQPAPS